LAENPNLNTAQLHKIVTDRLAQIEGAYTHYEMSGGNGHWVEQAMADKFANQTTMLFWEDQESTANYKLAIALHNNDHEAANAARLQQAILNEDEATAKQIIENQQLRAESEAMQDAKATFMTSLKPTMNPLDMLASWTAEINNPTSSIYQQFSNQVSDQFAEMGGQLSQVSVEQGNRFYTIRSDRLADPTGQLGLFDQHMMSGPCLYP